MTGTTASLVQAHQFALTTVTMAILVPGSGSCFGSGGHPVSRDEKKCQDAVDAVREQEGAVEAEIQAAGLGCTTAIAMLNLLRSLVGCDTLRVELLSDNTGCIANILHTVTTLRNRHFCVRAAALRDQLNDPVS